MPRRFFTEPPHWRWLIILYFFFGGLAGGCYFVASMLDLMGRPSDRLSPGSGTCFASRSSSCAVLLSSRLGRPSALAHDAASRHVAAVLKTYSPMSLGGVGAPRLRRLRVPVVPARLRRRRTAGAPRGAAPRPGSSAPSSPSSEAWRASSSCPTTGVLLAVTNRPICRHHAAGAVFLVSSASTRSAAAAARLAPVFLVDRTQGASSAST